MDWPSKYLRSSGVARLFKPAALFSIGLLGILTACGGGSGNGGTTPTPTPSSTTVQVNVGDAPADWMLAFSTSITSMSLTGANGSVTVSTSSAPVEMMQLMGTMQPIAMVSATQGTYTGASVTLGSCNVTYIDPSNGTLTQTTLQGPFTVSVPFNSPVTLGTTPLAFNFDLDLANSVTADSSGNLSFAPVFHFSSGMQGAGSANNPAYGGMQQIMGTVSSTSTGSFIMAPLQAAQPFTIMTNSATQFQGLASNMGMMGNGMGVLVSATLQPDGSLLATQVASRMQSGGIMGGGIVTSVTGQPATQLTIVMQNGAGASMMTSYLSQTVTVNLSSNTQFDVDDDRVDLSSLPFTPVFDATNIFAGQSVMPVNESGGMMSGGGMGGGMMGTPAGAIAASNVYLEEQGFRGTTTGAITPGGAQSFVLTLEPGCAFTTLTGATTILVYQQTGTNVQNNTSIAAGATLRVHGLLFKNAGQWTLVASTIAAY